MIVVKHLWWSCCRKDIEVTMEQKLNTIVRIGTDGSVKLISDKLGVVIMMVKD